VTAADPPSANRDIARIDIQPFYDGARKILAQRKHLFAGRAPERQNLDVPSCAKVGLNEAENLWIAIALCLAVPTDQYLHNAGAERPMARFRRNSLSPPPAAAGHHATNALR
jgi:hypothetical protein